MAQSKDNPANPLAAFLEMQQSGLGSLTWMQDAWINGMGDMSSDVARFISERVQEDLKTQKAILNCRDIGELQKIQAEFIRKAVADYTAETGKLVEISTEMLTPKPG